MADKRKDEEDWSPPERQLRADGRLTGDLPKQGPTAVESIAQPQGSSALPTLEALTTSELVLDLDKPGAARPQYVEPGPYREVVVPSRSGPLKWILLLGVLGLAALAAFAFVPGLQRKLSLPNSRGTLKGALVIYSEPSGATVRIAGKSVGETPWAGDNLWGGEVKYEISANGYKPSWGTFHGGSDVKLNVKLSRK